MNILITGGKGFIGHRIACMLERIRIKVSVVDNCMHDNLKELYEYRNNQFMSTETYHCDINDYTALSKVFEEVKPDFVIHCCGPSRQNEFTLNNILATRTIIEGLTNVLELSKENKVSKFIYCSSSMVYGNFFEYVTEDAVCDPIGQYGILKLAGENLVKHYSRQGYFNHIIIRPSAVYGPLDNTDRVISKFFIAANNNQPLKINGNNERLDFSYIDDVAEGIVKATLCNVRNKTYNITKGESFTLGQAAKMIIDIVGAGSIEYVQRDINMPSRGALSITNAKYDLGYAPKTSIWQGLKNYHEWISNTPFWVTKTV